MYTHGGLSNLSVWCRVTGHNIRTDPLSVNVNLPKKRPYNNTAKRAGGWRGSPNSIAALLANQVLLADQRKCRHCKRTALRERDVCRRHAGRTVLPATEGRAERRVLQGMERLGLLPADLLLSPAWRALGTLPTSRRSPIRLRLVLAWSERERQPLVWALAWRVALAAAANAPPDEGRRMVWRAA